MARKLRWEPVPWFPEGEMEISDKEGTKLDRDRAIYGTGFIDQQGRRIDPESILLPTEGKREREAD